LNYIIRITIQITQGKAFSQIVSLRHAYVSRKKERDELKSLYKRKALSESLYFESLNELKANFTQGASLLPDSSLNHAFNLFGEGKIPVTEIDYDLLVYDTYDYLDKVISLSLADPLGAAFQLYYNETADERALIIKNYIKYGTNDNIEIWLLRYGFGFEEIDWLKSYIEQIDENEIKFKPSINRLSQDKRKLIERFE